MKFSGTQKERASEIVEFMFTLHSIDGEPPLLAEYTIARFFQGTESGFRELVLSDDFFKGSEPGDVINLMLHTLARKTEEKVFPDIREFIEQAGFGFFDRISEEGTISDDFRREKLYSFTRDFFTHSETRLRLNSPYMLFRCGFIKKYLDAIYNRDMQLYESLVTVSSVSPGIRDAVVLFKFVMLAMNGLYRSDNLKTAGGQRDDLQYLKKLLPGFPSAVLEIAADAVAVKNAGEAGPAARDLAYILDLRFRNTGCFERREGCVAPDTSWFETALVSGMRSFHPDLLMVLKEIAVENNW